MTGSEGLQKINSIMPVFQLGWLAGFGQEMVTTEMEINSKARIKMYTLHIFLYRPARLEHSRRTSPQILSINPGAAIPLNAGI
jgi:hypothetical protein